MPQLRLHGPPSLRSSNSKEIALSAREAALLAWLHLEGPTSRSRLAGLLWPAGTESQARANLRQLLARLRRSAGDVLAQGDGLLRLAPDHEVLASPSGPLLGELAYDDAPEFAQWLSARREAELRARQSDGLAQGRRHLDRGELDAALAAADALLAEQPEFEEAWRLRMEVLFQRGDRAAAIAAWDACKHTLRTSFGVTPAAATNELGRLILASEGTPASPGDGPRSLPMALRRPPQIIGRQDLLADLGRFLALGRSAVVTGPGGIGKSRILQQLAADMEPALLLQARPGDAVLAGGLLSQLLAAAIDRFAPRLDDTTHRDLSRLLQHSEPAPVDRGATPGDEVRSELEHRRVMTAVWRVLSACQSRGLRLLLIEDLHYADDASLAVLNFAIGRWLAQSEHEAHAGLQVLMSARRQELSPAGQRLVDAVMGHANGHLFEVAPLQACHVHELVGLLPLPQEAVDRWGPDGSRALATALHAAVGGNPAFVLEALRSLFLSGFAEWQPGAALPVPATLRESVRRRVMRMSEDALQLAHLAAVAQSDFDATLAASAFGRTPLAMAPLFAELESAQVFHGAGFSHDLVAEAVQAVLPEALRSPLHRLVAEHLAGHGGADARVAHHLLAAGDTRAATPWQLSAARAARSRWQLAEAADAFAAAARSLDPTTEREQAFDAWCEALNCWLILMRFDDAGQGLKASAGLVRHVHERARWSAREARLLFYSDRWAEATAVCARLAEELADSIETLDPTELVYALRPVCWAVHTGLPAPTALNLCDAMRPAVASACNEARAGFALACGEVLWMASRTREAAATLEPVWPLLGSDSDPELRCAVASQLMRLRQALGDLAGAATLGSTLLELVDRTYDHALYADDALHFVGLLRIAQGHAADGMACFDALRVQPRRGHQPMSDAHVMAHALACLYVGRHGEARSLLTGLERSLGRRGYGLYDQIQCLARARLAAAVGDDVGLWIRRLMSLPAGPELVMVHRRVLLASLQALPLADIQAVLLDVRGRGLLGMVRCAELAAARSAMAAGATQLAAEHARAALALAGAVDPWCDEPATVWLVACDVLSSCGAIDEADAALAEGAAWVEQGTAQWSEAGWRRDWQEGNPVHQALLHRARSRGLACCAE